MAKKLVSVRMSDAGRELLATLQERMGVTQAGVMELALRELAKREGVPIPLPSPKNPGDE